MSLLKDIKSSITSESINDYITKILTDNINKKSFDIPDYLYVTDIINPVYSYYSRKYPEIETPEKIFDRMKNGEETHFIARQWFEKIDGFSGSEVVLNGSNIDINIIGRSDFMVYDSIIEFKTKNTDNVSIDNLFDIYLSDLEQLLFYSIINKNFDKNNYLIFYVDEKFYVYRINIVDQDTIKNEILYRISLIKRSLINNDTALLPRCSYYLYGCKFKENNICTCNKLSAKNASWIKNSIKIEEDKEFENKLYSIYKNGENNIDLRFYDLIYPRKYYHKMMRDEITIENSKPSFDYEKNNIKFFILDIINSSILGVNGYERAEKNKENKIELYGDDKYIIKNIYDENSITPFLLKINNSKFTGKIPETYYSELAVTCARRNTGNGIIIVVYPRLDNKIVVHDINFDINKIINLCNQKINDINYALENKNPEILDLCPEFTINSCPYKNCSCKMEIIKRS